MRRAHRILVAPIVAVLLAGCGGGGDGDVETTDGSEVASPDTDPEPAPEGPAAGDDEDGSDPPDDAPAGETGDRDLDARVQTAIDELAADEGVDPSAIEVGVAEETTWPDGSLGCPEPDGMYTQALVDGYRIVLEVDGLEVAYHGAVGEDPFRCDRPVEPNDPDS